MDRKWFDRLALGISVVLVLVLVQITNAPATVKSVNSNRSLLATPNAFAAVGLDPFAFSQDGKTLASIDAGGGIKLMDLASGQNTVGVSHSIWRSCHRPRFQPRRKDARQPRQPLAYLMGCGAGSTTLDGGLRRRQAFQRAGIQSGQQSPGRGGPGCPHHPVGYTAGAVARIFDGRQQSVNGVAFSPNGSILASAGKGTGARLILWDVASGQARSGLSATGGLAFADPVFSPDGKTVASFGQDARITLLDPQSGSVEQVLASRQKSLNRIAFSPDGKLLASGGTGAQIELWDMATGQTRSVLPGYGGAEVTDVVFNPDGTILASVGADYRISLWDVSSGELRHVLAGHAGAIAKLAFSSTPGGQTLASVGKDGQVIVWDVATGTERLALQVPILDSTPAGQQGSASGGAAAVSSQPAAAATATNSGLVNGDSQSSIAQGASKNANMPGNAANAKKKKRSSHKWKGVAALAISPDGTLYGGSGEDGKVRVWGANGKERLAFKGHHGAAVTVVAFSADGNRIISAGRDSEVHIWNVTTGATWSGPTGT